MTRTPAPALSPAEVARVATFDAAPYPREVAIERANGDVNRWARAALASPAPAPQGEEGQR